VTYSSDPIQSILNDLDRTLRQTERWNLWTIFTSLSQQRHMLERVRNFLILHSQQQQSTHAAKPQPPANTTSATPTRPLPLPPPLHSESIKLELTALNAQRDALNAQRDALREEIKFLEQRKAQYLQDQSVMDQSSFTQAISPSPLNSQSSHNLSGYPILSQLSNPGLTSEHLEQLKALHDRTDFLLSSMDSSLQLAFTSMQKNVEVYQTTLHQGLDRMHNLGYQGEVFLSALVNQLAQQLGRELSNHPVSIPDTTQTTFTPPPEIPSQILPPPPEISPLDAPTPPPETAVFSKVPDPNSVFFHREITLGDLFNDSSVESSVNSSVESSVDSSVDSSTDRTSRAGSSSEVTEDMTLEEMNRLFADIPSLQS
jgi:hypothetical protein